MVTPWMPWLVVGIVAAALILGWVLGRRQDKRATRHIHIRSVAVRHRAARLGHTHVIATRARPRLRLVPWSYPVRSVVATAKKKRAKSTDFARPISIPAR